MKDLNEEQVKRFEEFMKMDDMEYFEKYLADASVEELAAFLEEFPEFMSEEGEREDWTDRNVNLEELAAILAAAGVNGRNCNGGSSSK